MPGGDKLGKAVGIVKVPHARVALHKIEQRLRLDNAGKPAQDEEDEDLYIQLFVYHSVLRHRILLLWFSHAITNILFYYNPPLFSRAK